MDIQKIWNCPVTFNSASSDCGTGIINHVDDLLLKVDKVVDQSGLFWGEIYKVLFEPELLLHGLL